MGFLVLPSQLLQMYGAATDEAGTLGLRAFGIFALLVASALWVMRRPDDRSDTLLFVAAMAAGNLVLGAIAASAQFEGTLNGLGWLNVGLFALFGSAYAMLTWTTITNRT
jgi:hypothetical protein